MEKISDFLENSFKTFYDKKYDKDIKKKKALKKLIEDLEKKIKTLKVVYEKKKKNSIKKDLKTAICLLIRSKQHLKELNK